MLYLRQSTAVTISFGPAVLFSDGVTLVTNLTGTGTNQTENTTTGIRLSKNGGAFAARHATAGASTYDAFGNYLVPLDTTDTGTLGTLRMQYANAAAFCPIFQDFMVLNTALYDALFAASGGAIPNVAAGASTGLPLSVDASGRVDVLKINGTSQTARDIGASVLLSSGTGTGQLNFTSGVVDANTKQWIGGTIPAVNVTGVPLVDAKYLLGTIFSTPATAGILDANIKNINNVVAATPGAAGGVLIAGTNAATTFNEGVTISSSSHALTLASNGTGDGIHITTNIGHGIYVAAGGTSMHGIYAIGGTAGTCDGVHATAGSGGVDIRGNITGNLVGTVSTLTTYTGNTPQTGDSYAVVKSGGTGDAAAIKTKTDFLPSATAGAAGGVFIAGTNAATTITTGLTTTFTGNLTGSVASVTGNIGGISGVTIPSTIASPTNITAGTITTVTNLTNAPTVGDLTSTMKTSVTTAATAATPVAASVTGNVGGNVVGSVASVTARVTANTDQIAGSATAASDLQAGALGLVTSTCSVASTTSLVTTNLTVAVNNFYTGRVITFTSGSLTGQTAGILNYNGTTKVLTVTTLTSAPANTDAFVIS
jgi:hypothetical protein